MEAYSTTKGLFFLVVVFIFLPCFVGFGLEELCTG